jgi:hypothetical protein
LFSQTLNYLARVLIYLYLLISMWQNNFTKIKF